MELVGPSRAGPSVYPSFVDLPKYIRRSVRSQLFHQAYISVTPAITTNSRVVIY